MAQYSADTLQKALDNATKAGDKEAIAEIQAALDQVKPGFLASVGKGDLPGAWDAWSREVAQDPPVADAAVQGVFNAPGSAAKTVMDTIVTPIMHPIQTAQALGVVGKGALEYAGAGLKELEPEWLKPYVNSKYSLDKPTPEMEASAEVGKGLVRRGVHWRETLRDDPVGGLVDVLGTVMTGGAATAATVPGRVGRVAGRVARTAEKFQPGNLVTKPAYGIIKHLPFVGEDAAMARMRRGARTPEQVQAESTRRYEDLRQQGIEIQPQDHRAMVAAINQEIAPENLWSEAATPQARGVIAAINENMAAGQAPLQAAVQRAQTQLDSARQRARASAATGSPSAAADAARVTRLERLEEGRLAQARRGPPLTYEAAEKARREAMDVNAPGTRRPDVGLANRVLGRIDQAFETLPDLPQVRAAREAGRQNLLANVLQRIQHSPERMAGHESSVRSQISSYLRSHGHKLTETERNAFNQIVAREGVQNIMHTLSSRLGLLGGTIGGTLGTTHPLIGTAAAVGTNVAARKAAESLTDKQLQRALETVLAGREAQATATRRAHLRRTVGRGIARGASAVGTGYGMLTE